MRRLSGSLVRVIVASLVVIGMAATVAASDSSMFRVDLRGSNEVPAADADGRGWATVNVDAAAGTVCFDVSFADAGTANRGHIHRGVAGVNGPIVVAFFDLQDNAVSQRDPRHDALEAKNRLAGCIENLSSTLLTEIQGNPAGFYVNLHNARFPGGMVRAQLSGPGRADD